MRCGMCRYLDDELAPACMLAYSSVQHSTSGITETRRKLLQKVSSAPRTNAINIQRRRRIPTKRCTRFLRGDSASHGVTRVVYSELRANDKYACNRQPVYLATCRFRMHVLVMLPNFC